LRPEKGSGLTRGKKERKEARFGEREKTRRGNYREMYQGFAPARASFEGGSSSRLPSGPVADLAR
jgi:hypothetical protein